MHVACSLACCCLVLLLCFWRFRATFTLDGLALPLPPLASTHRGLVEVELKTGAAHSHAHCARRRHAIHNGVRLLPISRSLWLCASPSPSPRHCLCIKKKGGETPPPPILAPSQPTRPQITQLPRRAQFKAAGPRRSTHHLPHFPHSFYTHLVLAFCCFPLSPAALDPLPHHTPPHPHITHVARRPPHFLGLGMGRYVATTTAWSRS